MEITRRRFGATSMALGDRSDAAAVKRELARCAWAQSLVPLFKPAA
jgi:hypothetical protein